MLHILPGLVDSHAHAFRCLLSCAHTQQLQSDSLLISQVTTWETQRLICMMLCCQRVSPQRILGASTET